MCVPSLPPFRSRVCLNSQQHSVRAFRRRLPPPHGASSRSRQVRERRANAVDDSRWEGEVEEGGRMMKRFRSYPSGCRSCCRPSRQAVTLGQTGWLSGPAAAGCERSRALSACPYRPPLAGASLRRPASPARAAFLVSVLGSCSYQPSRQRLPICPARVGLCRRFRPTPEILPPPGGRPKSRRPPGYASPASLVVRLEQLITHIASRHF